MTIPAFKKHSKVWLPVSAHAYGASAVYIPDYEKRNAVEIIAVLTQNYPDFKTHPVLDGFRGYVCGKERFEHNHYMRVLAWQSDLSKNYFSYLYLPEDNTDVRMNAGFCYDRHGNLKMEFSLNNPTPKQREWQIDFYISPVQTEELIGFKQNELLAGSLDFDLTGVNMKFNSSDFIFQNLNITDSSYWVNFPVNIEYPQEPDNPISLTKSRLKLMTKPFVIDADSKRTVCINVLTDNSTILEAKIPSLEQVPEDKLPFEHEWWELAHNRQYSQSFSSKSIADKYSIESQWGSNVKEQPSCNMTGEDKMTLRLMPAKQWGRFYIWDSGMTLLGAVERDKSFTQQQLSEMPDPEYMGNKIYKNMGAFIPTAIFSWWELYNKTQDKAVLAEHYPLMKRLLEAYYSWPNCEFTDGNDGLVRVEHNSNGIDDYPPRVYVAGRIFGWEFKKTLPVNPDREYRPGATCPETTAFGIRFAKILRLAAFILDISDDVDMFTRLIDKSTKALNDYLWDEEQGVYVWSCAKEGKLSFKGLTGAYPLLAGDVPADREEKLFEFLSEDNCVWTDYGFTAVPQSSEFYRDNGYWNGAIWLPPQWFMWKAFYNLGKKELVDKVAKTAMELWKSNHIDSYCCWEEFRVNTGKGGGNSRFSGLSAPVLAFDAAMTSPGRVQYSQDIIATYKVEKDLSGAEVVLLSPFTDTESCFSIVLVSDTEYKIDMTSSTGNNRFNLKTDRNGYMIFDIKTDKAKELKIKITRI